MSNNNNLTEAQLAELVQLSDGRYHAKAFEFLISGLRLYYDEAENQVFPASAEDLCWSCAECAMDSYGMMAKDVLAYWGVTTTNDLGRITWLMIKTGMLQVSPDDKDESEFDDVFDFTEVIWEDYQIEWLVGGLRHFLSEDDDF